MVVKSGRSNEKNEMERNSKLVGTKKAAKRRLRSSKGIDFVTGNTVGMLIRPTAERDRVFTRTCVAKSSTHGKTL